MALDETLFDKRVLPRNRRKNLLTEEQLKDVRKKLPDVRDKSEPLGVDRPAGAEGRTK